MAVLKCEMCGGELDLNADMTVGICQYCGGKNIIPKDMDKKEKLYNYATHLRQNNEFDRAVRVYEDLLKEDSSNAEAHWGMLLSKLAIEYVKDPATGEMLPTCHRGQMESILVDIDYKAVMKYASSGSQKYYEEKAKQIAGIQEKMLEIAKKEPPYDIFICYKELDEKGERTDDSVLAQEIYEKLCKKGYRVFFARKTLQHKLGTEYEPYIFSALNSSRVMIVVGTKTEHLESTWVRNEWSRYYKLAHKENSEKVMICAYKGMSPYELPTELAILQGQDMDTIGGMQNLCDGIELLIGRKESGKEKEDKRLLKNAETYLDLGDYKAAEKTYQELTQKYPEVYQGWWGLIMIKTRNLSEIVPDISELNALFQSVKILCPSGQFEEYEKQYISYLRILANVDAAKEMENVNALIEELKAKIRYVEMDKGKLDYLLEREEMQYQYNLENNESDRSGMYVLGCSLILTSAISIGCIPALLNTTIFVIVIFIILGILLFAAGIKSISSGGRLYGQEQQEFKEKEEKRYLERVEQLNKEKEQYGKEEIMGYEEQIAVYEGYLKFGKAAIAEIFLAKRCKKIGKEYEIDLAIQEYRKKIGKDDDDIEKILEKVKISCPCCGNAIQAVRNEVLNRGYVICEKCQSTIEVSSS